VAAWWLRGIDQVAKARLAVTGDRPVTEPVHPGVRWTAQREPAPFWAMMQAVLDEAFAANPERGPDWKYVANSGGPEDLRAALDQISQPRDAY